MTLNYISLHTLITQVYVNWRNRLEETYDTTPKVLEAYYDQVVECTEIAVSSMEDKRENRPTVAQIVSRLDGTEAAIEKVPHLVNLPTKG
jgi:hypothetical protein